jgi:hypothetical protein
VGEKTMGEREKKTIFHFPFEICYFSFLFEAIMLGQPGSQEFLKAVK